MSASLCGMFGGLRMSRPAPVPMAFKASLSPLHMRGTPWHGFARTPRRPVLASATATLVKVEAKQNSLRRQRTSEKARQRNRARKSEVKTRIKKVLKAVDTAAAEPPVQSEAELSGLARLMTEAYRAVDKAVSKGALHRNTGARRKSRIALARQRLLVAAGLYVPGGEDAEVETGGEDAEVETGVENVQVETGDESVQVETGDESAEAGPAPAVADPSFSAMTEP